MQWSDIEAGWADLGSIVQARWGKLTDDDLLAVGGRRVKLIGRIQRRYHLSFRVARDQVDGWRDAVAPHAAVPLPTKPRGRP